MCGHYHRALTAIHSSYSFYGLAPVSVQCLHDNSSPALRTVLRHDAECLRVCRTPFFDVVHPLSAQSSSPVWSIYDAEYHVLQQPVVIHPIEMCLNNLSFPS